MVELGKYFRNVKFFLDCYFRFDNYAEAMMKDENLPIGFPDIPEMRESLWLKPIIELFNKQS